MPGSGTDRLSLPSSSSENGEVSDSATSWVCHTASRSEVRAKARVIPRASSSLTRSSPMRRATRRSASRSASVNIASSSSTFWKPMACQKRRAVTGSTPAPSDTSRRPMDAGRPSRARSTRAARSGRAGSSTGSIPGSSRRRRRGPGRSGPGRSWPGRSGRVVRGRGVDGGRAVLDGHPDLLSARPDVDDVTGGHGIRRPSRPHGQSARLVDPCRDPGAHPATGLVDLDVAADRRARADVGGLDRAAGPGVVAKEPGEVPEVPR